MKRAIGLFVLAILMSLLGIYLTEQTQGSSETVGIILLVVAGVCFIVSILLGRCHDVRTS